MNEDTNEINDNYVQLDDDQNSSPDVSKIVQKRLASQAKKHQEEINKSKQENEEMKKMLAEMNDKLSKYTSDDYILGVHQSLKAAEAEDEAKNKTQQAMQEKANKLKQKLYEVSEEDEEMKDLIQKGNPLSDLDLAFLGEFDNIKNMPAVVKKLLKDKTEHAIFMSAPSTYEAAKYIKELSDKIDGRNDGKQKYQPIEKIKGTSINEYDVSRQVDRMKNRGRRKK
jgi:predicted RNase H-like nuclease (RuvC/YqgF family)